MYMHIYKGTYIHIQKVQEIIIISLLFERFEEIPIDPETLSVYAYIAYYISYITMYKINV